MTLGRKKSGREKSEVREVKGKGGGEIGKFQQGKGSWYYYAHYGADLTTATNCDQNHLFLLSLTVQH